MSHKAGFVNIVGNPNVGKSTLSNILVGERLSIITSKSQTTRHRIMGIVNGEDYQIVYSDTPGVLNPKYKLQESMLSFSRSALVDADVILYVTDVTETAEKYAEFLEKVQKCNIPTILVINKIDLTSEEELKKIVEKWQGLLPDAEIFICSATNKFNTQAIADRILEMIPESPPYYDKDSLTDKPERFFVGEIIREKILLNYQKEIPYSVEVIVESFKEEENIICIGANIMVARDSQKGIIIGHRGKMLKKVGTAARIDMESFLQKKVFLELYVKVDKNWRDNDKALKRYGY